MRPQRAFIIGRAPPAAAGRRPSGWCRAPRPTRRRSCAANRPSRVMPALLTRSVDAPVRCERGAERGLHRGRVGDVERRARARLASGGRGSLDRRSARFARCGRRSPPSRRARPGAARSRGRCRATPPVTSATCAGSSSRSCSRSCAPRRRDASAASVAARLSGSSTFQHARAPCRSSSAARAAPCRCRPRRRSSTPSREQAPIDSSQRTGAETCRRSAVADRVRRRAPAAASTLVTTGAAASRNATPARCGASRSCAGSISGEWNAPTPGAGSRAWRRAALRASHGALAPPRPRPRSRPGPGALRLAGAHDLARRAASGQAASTAAAVEPEDRGHRARADRHRLLHELRRAGAPPRSASSNASAPAATQRRVLAEAVAGHAVRAARPRGHERRRAATLVREQRRLGVGGLLQLRPPAPRSTAARAGSRARRRPRSKTSRAAGSASASARPMPTFCAPWPGNRKASAMRSLASCGCGSAPARRPAARELAPRSPRSRRSRGTTAAVRMPCLIARALDGRGRSRSSRAGRERRAAVLARGRCAASPRGTPAAAGSAPRRAAQVRSSSSRIRSQIELRQRLGGLQHHVAGEAVHHHHVRPAVEQVVPLDVADEVEVRRA